ncbi:hypothetical protein KBZ21_41130, partial [Streptomyces sp. A73]|nr:hypothetical protein [Streptomyces sp. A73]
MHHHRSHYRSLPDGCHTSGPPPRHSPARVLAEVDAKRGLLDRYAEVADMDYEDNEPEYAYGRAT